MAKNRYRVTDEKIKLVFKLYPITRNQRLIAKAVDLSQGTVCKILGAENVRKIAAPKDSVLFDWKDFNNSVL
jgi:hypothetical protein